MCDSHFLGADFLASGGEDQQCEKMSRIVDSLYLPRAAAGGEITILLTASPAVGAVPRSQWCQNSILLANVTVAQPAIDDYMTLVVFEADSEAESAQAPRPVNAEIVKLTRNFSTAECSGQSESSLLDLSCSLVDTAGGHSLASKHVEVGRLLEACARDRTSASNDTGAVCPDGPSTLPLCSTCLPVGAKCGPLYSLIRGIELASNRTPRTTLVDCLLTPAVAAGLVQVGGFARCA